MSGGLRRVVGSVRTRYMGCNARDSNCVGCVGNTGVTKFVGITRTVLKRKVVWSLQLKLRLFVRGWLRSWAMGRLVMGLQVIWSWVRGLYLIMFMFIIYTALLL